MRSLALSRAARRLLRTYSTTAKLEKPFTLTLPSSLIDGIHKKAEESKQILAKLKTNMHSPISTITVQTALGGMRGAPLLVCETSTVDPFTGLEYRGMPVAELLPKLPSFSKDKGVISGTSDTYPASESLLWLLLTGSVPTCSEVEDLRQALVRKMKLPEHVVSAIRSLPTTAHPMSQLITGLAASQTESTFAPLYSAGSIPRSDHWKYTLEDGLSVIAKLPALASWIYRRISVRPELGLVVPTPDRQQDWSGNLAQMLGFPSKEMEDVVRLYMFLHADHEGGNVSAHAGHLVSSALSDPYLAFCASMAGLAAPLHGLANQQCLMFFRKVQSDFAEKQIPLTAESMKNYIQTTILDKGQVVPGFGHAVLRVTDPRFTLQNEFAKKTMADDTMFKLLSLCTEVVPPILKATGKVQNPYPNVDAHSGIILNHFGLTEEHFFTVLFGVSRSLGVVSQIVWDRILGLPIERPKSTTLKKLHTLSQQAK